jgi:hypothetical protein
LKKVGAISKFIKKSTGFSTNFATPEISRNCFCIIKVMDRVYGSRDHDWLSDHGGLATMGQCGRSESREVVMIAQREGERGQGSHQWRHLEAELWRWPHDGAS